MRRSETDSAAGPEHTLSHQTDLRRARFVLLAGQNLSIPDFFEGSVRTTDVPPVRTPVFRGPPGRMERRDRSVAVIWSGRAEYGRKGRRQAKGAKSVGKALTGKSDQDDKDKSKQQPPKKPGGGE